MVLQVKNVNELRKCIEENQTTVTSGKLAVLLRQYGVCGGGSKGLQQRFMPIFESCKVKGGYDLTKFDLGLLPDKPKSLSKIEKLIGNMQTVAEKYGYKLNVSYTELPPVEPIGFVKEEKSNEIEEESRE